MIVTIDVILTPNNGDIENAHLWVILELRFDRFGSRFLSIGHLKLRPLQMVGYDIAVSVLALKRLSGHSGC
jgi:hypothetical protein